LGDKPEERAGGEQRSAAPCDFVDAGDEQHEPGELDRGTTHGGLGAAASAGVRESAEELPEIPNAGFEAAHAAV